MKKIFLLIATIVVFVVILFIFYSNSVIKEMKVFGCNQYYVKIPISPPRENDYEDWKYTYSLGGYSDHGENKILSFTSDRILRSNAYLKVYVCNENDVVTWEEVKLNDIPSNIQKNLTD